jgi:hypothetical protein
MLCAVYTMRVEMSCTGFLVEPQNQGRRFVSGLVLKPLGRFGLKTTETMFGFLWFGLKIGGVGFL